MIRTLSFIIIYMSEAAILICYLMQMLKPDRTRLNRSIPAILAVYLALYAISYTNNLYANLGAFIGLHILLFYFILDQPIKLSLFHTIVLTMCMGIGELLVLNAREYFAVSFYSYWINEESLVFISILSKLLYLALMEAFVIFYRKMVPSANSSGERFSYLGLPILLSSLWGIITLFAICSTKIRRTI